MTLTILCSAQRDGSMKTQATDQSADTSYNRRVFLAQNGITMDQTTLVRIVYEGTDYCRYKTVDDSDKGDGMTRDSGFISDAMVVTRPGHALFLPLADCIGAVIHDPVENILMLSHLGRHNLEQFGGTKSIEYLINEHGVIPTNLTAWLSPAADKDLYPLYAFDNRSLHDVATEQFLAAGVTLEHIESSPINSAADKAYYSHSQFLKGNRPNDGRFAVVAILND